MNDRKTIFSDDRRYRYTLWREWDMTNPSYAMFIGLNPSTADETQDDPTIRRCIGFAKSWGYGALCMTNLFAFRATDPEVMKQTERPIGEWNDGCLLECSKTAGVIVAAWGNHGSYRARSQQVMRILPLMKCLKKTKTGHPQHPLYLPSHLTPINL